jgi:putative oxidoreductase
MAQIKSSNHSMQQARWQKITAWILQILVAVFFLAAGVTKLMGSQEMVTEFARMGFGQWFRYVTGMLEVTAALLLLLPRTAFWGGTILATMMLACASLHLFRMDSDPVFAIVMLFISGTIAWLRRPYRSRH